MYNFRILSKKISFAFLLLFLACFVFAEPVTVQLHLAITETKTPEKPKVIDDHLVLTYKGEREFRFVGAAFKHEDFKTIHPFYKNTNGVYILVYPLKEGISVLDYRMVADGLWMPDPKNKTSLTDAGGITLSRFLVPQKKEPPESPIKNENIISFQYFGLDDQKVYLYGDFNNWDPFMYKMTEKKGKGIYTCSVRISPGKYLYKFIVDGTTMPDPLNDNKGIDLFGEIASVLALSYN